MGEWEIPHRQAIDQAMVWWWEEGFDCPAAMPFRFQSSDGVVVCGPSEAPPAGGVDELVRAETTREGLAKLKPAFAAKGVVTAGNSSPLSDGAAAVLMMSADAARARCTWPAAAERVGEQRRRRRHRHCAVARRVRSKRAER